MLMVIDTCTERLVVGIRSAETGDRWINLDARDRSDGPGNHARELLSAVERLAGDTVPLAVGVALGPGSFTGVRIGLATAKGLAEGWGVPLIGLDNLEAMAAVWARQCPDSEAAVLPVIDARKKKFYGGLYRSGELVAPADQSASDWVEAAARVWNGPVVLSGYQGSVLAQALGADLPAGWEVLDLQDWTPGLLDQAERHWAAATFLPPGAAPRYLRLSEAEENLRRPPA